MYNNITNQNFGISVAGRRNKAILNRIIIENSFIQLMYVTWFVNELLSSEN